MSSEERNWTDAQVEAAFAHLKRGGLILLKGDIGYGFFGISEEAIRKMYRLKGRPYTNPCIFIGNLQILDDLAKMPHPAIRRFIARTIEWTTCAVVLPENPESALLGTLSPWVYNQSVTHGTLALFLRCGGIVDALVQRALGEGLCFVGTSANRSFEGNTFEYKDLPREFIEGVEYSLDHGRALLANDDKKATTIVNFTNWTLKRRGVHWERINDEFEALQRELGVGAAAGTSAGAA